MKNLFTLIFFLLCYQLLTAQYRFNAAGNLIVATAPNPFHDLPLKPHLNKVDVYLNGEKPNVPYYKIRLLQLSGAANYNDLLANMQLYAQNEGFDGLILMEKSNYVYQDNRVGTAIAYGTVAGLTGNKNYEYHAPLLNGQTLSCLGLKYRSRIGYIDTIVKTVHISINDAEKTEYDIAFTMNGDWVNRNDMDACKFYENEIGLFKPADYFLMHPITSFAEGIDANDPRFANAYAKMETDTGMVKITAAYNNSYDLQKVDFKMPRSEYKESPHYLQVRYDTNDWGGITKRVIMQGLKLYPYVMDIYSYDEKNRNTGFIRYDTRNKKELFRVEYTFYSMNDLPECDK